MQSDIIPKQVILWYQWTGKILQQYYSTTVINKSNKAFLQKYLDGHPAKQMHLQRISLFTSWVKILNVKNFFLLISVHLFQYNFYHKTWDRRGIPHVCQTRDRRVSPSVPRRADAGSDVGQSGTPVQMARDRRLTDVWCPSPHVLSHVWCPSLARGIPHLKTWDKHTLVSWDSATPITMQ